LTNVLDVRVATCSPTFNRDSDGGELEVLDIVQDLKCRVGLLHVSVVGTSVGWHDP